MDIDFDINQKLFQKYFKLMTTMYMDEVTPAVTLDHDIKLCLRRLHHHNLHYFF